MGKRINLYGHDMYLLTEWKSQMGKYMVPGPYVLTQSQTFSHPAILELNTVIISLCEKGENKIKVITSLFNSFKHFWNLPNGGQLYFKSYLCFILQTNKKSKIVPSRNFRAQTSNIVSTLGLVIIQSSTTSSPSKSDFRVILFFAFWTSPFGCISLRR